LGGNALVTARDPRRALEGIAPTGKSVYVDGQLLYDGSGQSARMDHDPAAAAAARTAAATLLDAALTQGPATQGPTTLGPAARPGE
jgi:hypothetical protein